MPDHKFLAWAATASIGVEPRYAAHWPRNLSFQLSTADRRFWTLPENPGGKEALLDSMLGALEPRAEIYLWQKEPGGLEELKPDSVLIRHVLAEVGPAFSSDDALVFRSPERDRLLGLLLCAAIYGWSWPHDMYVVSDQRDAILMLDHHECVWAEFPNAERRERFIERMHAAGFELPRDYPDSTFKPQGWIDPAQPS